MSGKPRSEDNGMYIKKYSMYEHAGTTEGHEKWLRAGAVHFEATRFLVLALILRGAFDPTNLVRNWPYVPEGWSPTVIGDIPPNIKRTVESQTGRNREKKAAEIDTAIAEAESKLRDIKKKIKQMEKDRMTPRKVEDKESTDPMRTSTQDSKTVEADAMTPAIIAEDEDKITIDDIIEDDDDDRFNWKSYVEIEDLNNQRKRLEDEISALHAAMEKLINDEVDENADSRDKLVADQFIYLDFTDIEPIMITVKDLKDAHGQLNLWMSSTAPKLMVKSIDADAPNHHVSSYVVLATIDSQFGNDKSPTGNLSLIGKAANLKFRLGKESAYEYFKRMLSIINEIEGYDELRDAMLKAAPAIFIGKISQPRYGVYEQLAQHFLLNVPEFSKLCVGPAEKFAKKVNEIERTMKCKQKTEYEQRRKQRESRANAARGSENAGSSGKKKPTKTKSKKEKKKTRANAAKGEKSGKKECKNCDNDSKLLKHHNRQPHWTKDCPFENSRKTKEYFAKNKILVDGEKFPSFASQVSDKDSDGEYSSESDSN